MASLTAERIEKEEEGKICTIDFVPVGFGMTPKGN